jgi:hypothetical protein
MPNARNAHAHGIKRVSDDCTLMPIVEIGKVDASGIHLDCL